MTTPAKLNELNHTEEPARRLLEGLAWKCVTGEAMAGWAPVIA